MQANQSGWFKSSYSAQNGDCVEARRRADGGLDVRDSKDSSNPVIAVTAHHWAAFATAVKEGAFETR
jgi:hypothetical protein